MVAQHSTSSFELQLDSLQSASSFLRVQRHNRSYFIDSCFCSHYLLNLFPTLRTKCLTFACHSSIKLTLLLTPPNHANKALALYIFRQSFFLPLWNSTKFDWFRFGICLFYFLYQDVFSNYMETLHVRGSLTTNKQVDLSTRACTHAASL